MKDRDFVYCEVRQEAPGGLYIIYGESLSDGEAAQAGAHSCRMQCSAYILRIKRSTGIFFEAPEKDFDQVVSQK